MVKRTLRGHCGSGFTLIELLVVILIIATLAGMLLPVLGGIMRRAESLECQANLKQIALAVLNYTTDYEGMIPPTMVGSAGTERYWCNILAKRDVPAQNTFGMPDTERATMHSILFCPATTDLRVRLATDFKDPDALEAQGWYRLPETPTDAKFQTDCSYFWNGYVGDDTELRKRFPSLSVDPSRPKEIDYHNISEIRKPGLTVVAADGVFFNGYEFPQRIAASHTGTYGGRQLTNMAFFDAHVESLDRYAPPKGNGTEDDWLQERPAEYPDDELDKAHWDMWPAKPIMSRETVLGEKLEGGPPDFMLPKR